jgi:hypothetical protein
MNIEGENTKLKQFLLGSQSEKEAEEIGVQILADRSFADKMAFAEEELIEEFLDEALTTEERELFFKNFLTTPARSELLNENVLLRSYARNHLTEASERVSEEKKSGNFFDALKGFLSLNLRPLAAALIILAFVGIGLYVYIYNAGGGLSQTEKDYAALNAKDLSNPSETANLSSKSLLAGTFRDTDSASKLTAANLTENVLFRLALPSGTTPDKRFNLELIRGGQTVFKQTNLRVYQNPNGQELKVLLPKAVLSKGTYQIKLNDDTTFGFAVE